MPPSRVARGAAESSSSSDLYFQGEGRFPSARNSQFTSNCGNTLNSVLPGHAGANMAPIPGDVGNAALNNVLSSVSRAGVNYLGTGTNSGLSGGPNLQRNASFNTDSQMLTPTSPMSFTSIARDGPLTVQDRSNQELDSQVQQRQENQGASCPSSLPISRMGQLQVPAGPRERSPLIQDPFCMSHLQKKPRLDIKQEDVLQHQVLHHLLQRQDAMHLQNSNPQLQALIQHRLRQQQEQQHLQCMSPMQRLQFLQQHHQIRPQVAPQGLQSALGTKRPYDGSVCSRRLMQFLYHQRQRPDNSLSYWRNFVAEYYSPRAKKKWCLSLYPNVAGVFPQPGDVWQCGLCCSKPGRGFEAPFGGLAKLYQTKFNSGVIDELLFLGLPSESPTPGTMTLYYKEAILETVYEQVRVVHEGKLRIVFTHDLKILLWEFCPRRHEEFIPHRLVAPQVNRFAQLVQHCQDKISESEPDAAVPQSDLQTQTAMIATAGRQLARNFEVPFLNEWGIPKRFGRFLQIVDVVNSMKDLMDFCDAKKVGPIDGLKNFPRSTPQTTQMPSCSQDPQTNQNILHNQITASNNVLGDTTNNQTATSNHGLSDNATNNQHTILRGAFAGPAQAALALTNRLTRENSMSTAHVRSPQPEVSSSSSPAPATPAPTSAAPATVQSTPTSDFYNSQALQRHSGNQGFRPEERNRQMQAQDVSCRNQGASMASQNSIGCKNNSPEAGHVVENLVRQPPLPPAAAPAPAAVENGLGGNSVDDERRFADELLADVGFFEELDDTFWR
ncbi:probable transcriptional regulator SLK2 [Andrographis paniculata]|uniref:probable transcriptional regulator SLK2 n=1 Tax=Andrographis paniculata TaxID=175694 RepID=UPI0021E896F1|nr:probable transcriptional regulator SLK2 [Andrographis paniculata]XP_051143268.1 probable transcriptional regulator SLK2 [Andrographis paniculata]